MKTLKYTLSDPDTRSKRAEDLKRKRNPLAREVLERKGPFSPKIVDPRKTEYKRVKLDPKRIRNYYDEFEDNEEY